MTAQISRRRALTIAGTGAAGAVAAGGVGFAGARILEPAQRASGTAVPDAVEFFGEHQAGIITPAQDRLHFVAFDVTTTDRTELVELMREWTVAAQRMTRGLDAGPIGAVNGPPHAPPDDTGEASDLRPAGLTLTVGFGPTLFRTEDGRDRFGLADRRPEALVEVPRFPGDALRPEISGGDICLQACANDPQVAVHAVRNLARIGFGKVSVRWSQLGFGRTSSTSTSQVTARNLFGFKDGTANLKAEQVDLLKEHLWVGAADGPDWMVGGSYLVTRKIRMLIETSRRTSGWRMPAPPGEPGCCGAATTSWTALTGSGGWTPGCSSWPTSGIPVASSSRSSGTSRGPTPSTSTSGMSPARYSPARRGLAGPETSWDDLCWGERGDADGGTPGAWQAGNPS